MSPWESMITCLLHVYSDFVFLWLGIFLAAAFVSAVFVAFMIIVRRATDKI